MSERGQRASFNGATGMSDMAGEAVRVVVEPSGSERINGATGMGRLGDPGFYANRKSEIGRFALAILRKIDAMGSKFTADSPWKSH